MPDPTRAEALLPCPFCGGAVTLWRYPHEGDVKGWACGCMASECNVSPVAGAITEEDCIAAWNRRAAQAPASVPVTEAMVLALAADVAALVANEVMCPEHGYAGPSGPINAAVAGRIRAALGASPVLTDAEREALWVAEWGARWLAESPVECRECGASRVAGHAADCALGSALSKLRGTA